MGSVLLGIVARSRDDNKPSSDLNNNSEIVECAKEAHLLESPPLGIKHKPVNFKVELVTQKAAKIGKIAKISDRKVSSEKFIDQVSHRQTFLSTFVVCGTGRLSCK